MRLLSDSRTSNCGSLGNPDRTPTSVADEDTSQKQATYLPTVTQPALHTAGDPSPDPPTSLTNKKYFEQRSNTPAEAGPETLHTANGPKKRKWGESKAGGKKRKGEWDN